MAMKSGELVETVLSFFPLPRQMGAEEALFPLATSCTAASEVGSELVGDMRKPGGHGAMPKVRGPAAATVDAMTSEGELLSW